MYSATGVEPTKLTDATSGSVISRSTASLSPLTTLKTPSGRPASLSKSPIMYGTVGSFSLGFKINELPHAIDITNIHIGTIAGKLKVEIPTQTPRGCLMLQLSIFDPTFSEYSPLSK